MKQRAIVCVTSDLSTDQRVHRTCLTLVKCGYIVTEFGRLLPDSLPLERTYDTIRKKLWFRCGALFYAEYNIRLFCYLLTAKVDLIFSNDLDTLPAAFVAAKVRGKRLIYDTHEYFTELPEVVNRPIIKAIWTGIEQLIFPHLTDIITVNYSIAELYSKKYNKKIHVCRNIPNQRTKISSLTRKSLSLQNDKKIIIYQGALNIGRGLEWTLEAMPYINDAILLIIGDGDIRKKLETLTETLELNEKVYFFGKIEAELLSSYTSLADLGLCLLESRGLNYYYSLPNRIFDYLNANVPIVASNFPEIASIVKTYNTGVLIEHYEPLYLAGIINELLVKQFDCSHFELVKTQLCWEEEEKILISLVNKNS